MSRPTALSSIVDALRAGRREIVPYVNEICDLVEAQEPRIEAMLPEPGRRKRLIKEAEALQAHFPNKGDRPALYGALVAVKDIFHLSGFVTKAGSEVPPEAFAGQEATCISWLRDAGALILGKSVTTEFAYFEPGPTRNPHNPAHTPGGSSSGSAASVASGYCPLALGTQTAGSVIRPAAYCGVIGFKPTWNRIPTNGLLYFSRSVDHVGLFTQDIAGMALAAEVLCQAWRRAPEPDNLPVLGIPEGPYLEQAEPEALNAFEHRLSGLEEMGYAIKRIPMFPDIDRIRHLHLQLISAEFAGEHKEVYARYSERYRPRTAELIETGMKVRDEELYTARRHCAQFRAELERKMHQEDIDLWASPAAKGPAPEGIKATGSPDMNLPWTHAGVPAVTLPMGKAENGLPLGLQLAASFGADEYLLAWSRKLVESIG